MLSPTEESDSSVQKQNAFYTKVLGITFPGADFSEKNILDTINFQPNPGDIFLVTYPKAGTVWTQSIIWSILYKAEALPEFMDMMSVRFPYIEFAGIEVVNQLQSPRVMKTHLPRTHYHFDHGAKYIYVARNVKDLCTSYYHFSKQVVGTFRDKSFDEFLDLFLEGNVGFGSWYKHLVSWYDHKDDPNVLVLTYEWMKKNHVQAVLKIADFIGEKYKEELENDQALLEKIVENTSFQSMKEMPVVFPVMSNDDGHSEEIKVENKSINFFRKGEAGDWKNVLSKEQERKINIRLLSEPRIEEIMSLWKDLWTIEDLKNN